MDRGPRSPVTAGRGSRRSWSGRGRPALRDAAVPGPAARGAVSAPDEATIGDGPLLGALLFAAAVVLAAFTIRQGIAPHDEGLMLAAADRIADGQWPYRDFWINYPPGQLVVLGGLRALLGPSLLGWRVLTCLTDGLVALLAYRLARRRAARPTALLAWVAVAGAMAYPTLPGPNPPALALAFGAVLLAPRRALAAGGLAGLACWFRFEIGAAAILGVLMAMPRERRFDAFIAALTAAVVTLAPFAIAGGRAMVHDTVGFYGIQGRQRLPFPLHYHGPLKPSKLIEFYIPLILVAGLAAWAGVMASGLWGRFGRVTRRRAGVRIGRPGVPIPGTDSGTAHTRRRAEVREAATDPAGWALFPLGVVGLGYLLGRTDEFHLVPLAAVLPVMLAWAAATAARWRPGWRALLLVALALIAVHGLERRAGQALHPPVLAAVPGPAGDGVETDPADARALAALEAELGRMTRPGEPVFVANPRFDLVHAGDPLLYVITGHPNPTRFDVMQPGLVTTAPVQRAMIAELERAHTRIVIRWLDPRATLAEPNGAGRSSGVHLLDRFLTGAYRPIARYGVYQVLVSRGVRP